jgi:hypothetical protein
MTFDEHRSSPNQEEVARRGKVSVGYHQCWCRLASAVFSPMLTNLASSSGFCIVSSCKNAENKRVNAAKDRLFSAYVTVLFSFDSSTSKKQSTCYVVYRSDADFLFWASLYTPPSWFSTMPLVLYSRCYLLNHHVQVSDLPPSCPPPHPNQPSLFLHNPHQSQT